MPKKKKKKKDKNRMHGKRKLLFVENLSFFILFIKFISYNCDNYIYILKNLYFLAERYFKNKLC